MSLGKGKEKSCAVTSPLAERLILMTEVFEFLANLDYMVSSVKHWHQWSAITKKEKPARKPPSSSGVPDTQRFWRKRHRTWAQHYSHTSLCTISLPVFWFLCVLVINTWFLDKTAGLQVQFLRCWSPLPTSGDLRTQVARGGKKQCWNFASVS